MIAGLRRVRLRGPRLALALQGPVRQAARGGLTALVCGQAVINLAAVLGLAPLTGIPLPFVSYGGSSLIVSLAVGRRPP